MAIPHHLLCCDSHFPLEHGPRTQLGTQGFTVAFTLLRGGGVSPALARAPIAHMTPSASPWLGLMNACDGVQGGGGGAPAQA